MVAGSWNGPREVKRAQAQNTSLCGKKLARFRGRPDDMDLVCGTCRRLSDGGDEVRSVQAQIDAHLNAFNPALEQDYKFELLPLDDLSTDMTPDNAGGRVQRPLQEAKVRRILKQFSWARFNRHPTAVWARPDGTYHILDGQHQTEAAKRHCAANDLPSSTEVRCRVYRRITRQQAAEIFNQDNTDRSAVKKIDSFIVGIAEGDPDVIAVNSMVRSYGRAIGSNGSAGNIAGANKLLVIYRWPNGPEVLRKTLAANTAAWEGSPESSHNQVMEIIALFFRKYPQAEVTRVVHILRHESTLQPIQLVLTAKAEPKTWREVAVVKLRERYNNRLSPQHRLPE
jgi:hypothetical protein